MYEQGSLAQKPYSFTIEIIGEDIVRQHGDDRFVQQHEIEGAAGNVGDQDVGVQKRRHIIDIIVDVDAWLRIPTQSLRPIFPLRHHSVETARVHLN